MTTCPVLSIVMASRIGRIEPLHLALARQTFKDWELILKRGIAPAARARNAGAFEARGRFILFLDDDIGLVRDDLIERLIGRLEKMDARSAIGVPWRISDRANRFQRRGVEESFAHLSLEGGEECIEVPWNVLGAACLVVRRETFETLGGFDEGLVSGEDYEFLYRVAKNGGKIFALNSHRVEHDPPATFWKAVQKTIWYERGNAQVARKHPDARYRIRINGWAHAAGYLWLRTVLLLPLCFIKVSYLHRRPSLAWRPASAFLSYLGGWVYTLSWFGVHRHRYRNETKFGVAACSSLKDSPLQDKNRQATRQAVVEGASRDGAKFRMNGARTAPSEETGRKPFQSVARNNSLTWDSADGNAKTETRDTCEDGKGLSSIRPDKLKILYLITGLYIGGAERLLLALTRNLNRDRFEPVVCALVGGDLIPTFERAGVRVHDLAMKHKLDFGAVLRLKRIFDAERPHILHTHLLHADLLGRLMGRFCRIPVIVTTIHALEPCRRWRHYKILDRWVSKLNHAITAVSEDVKRSVVDVEHLDESKIEVLPNAIDQSVPLDADARAKKREFLGLSDQTLLIIMIGRLERFKGHHVFFHALKLLSYIRSNWHGVIVGSGPRRAYLEGLARDLGISNRISFVGAQTDPENWLAASDLFVQPSLREGSPLSVIEAMSAGVPIVATTVGGVPELIQDGESGMLVRPDDSAALSAAMNRVLSDPDGARKWGKKAQAQFETRYDMKKAVSNFETFYDRLWMKHGLRKIRLLEMATTIDRGGVTTYLAGLLRRFPDHQFEISLVSGLEDLHEPFIKEIGLPHHLIPSLVKRIHPLKDIKAIGQLYRLLRRERFDIVHSHMSKSDWVGGFAARLAGVPCVVSTAHGPTILTPAPSVMQRVFDRIERFTYRFLMDRVICVSEATRRELIEKRAAGAEKLVTILNGIELCQTPDESVRRGAARKEFSIGPNQLVIGMVGRLTEQKSPETLVESIRLLLRTHPDLVCLVIGDGPRRKFLSDLISLHGLERSVRLIGNRDDVPLILKACDVFVLATNFEGMSLSVLEAMAASLPVVAARVSGMDELVVHGRTGFLVSPGNSGALAEAVGMLLDHPDQRRQMGEEGCQRVYECFGLMEQAFRTAEILQETLQEKRSDAQSLLRWAAETLSRLRHFIREEGVRAELAVLFRRMTAPFFQSAKIWFLSRPVEGPVVRIKPRLPCVVRKAAPDDLERLFRAGFQSRSSLGALLHSPEDACFFAEQDGRVIAFQWITFGPRFLRIDPLERSIWLGEGEAYFYNCRALRAYRSQGIIPFVEAEVFDWLKAHGFRRLSTDIRADNVPSLGTFEKLGLQKTECVSYRRWFWMGRIRAESLRSYRKDRLRVLLVTGASGKNSLIKQFSKYRNASIEVYAVYIYSADPKNVNREAILNTAALDQTSQRQPRSDVRPSARPALDQTSQFGAVLSVNRDEALGASGKVVRQLAIPKGSFDVVHSDGLSSFPDATFLAQSKKIKHVCLSIENVDVAGRDFLSAAQKVGGSETTILCSEPVYRTCASAFGLRPERWHLIRDDIHWASFNGAVSMAEARRELGMAEAGRVVGTIVNGNDIHPRFLLSVFKKVHGSYPDCRFVMAGDGSAFQLLRRDGATSSFGNMLQLIRSKDDSRKILKAMDVYVQCGGGEKDSIPILEAMASAKPVVISGGTVWSSAAGCSSGGRALGPPAPCGRHGGRALGQTVPRGWRGTESGDGKAATYSLGAEVEKTAERIIRLLESSDRLLGAGQAARESVREEFQERHRAVQIMNAWCEIAGSDMVEVSAEKWSQADGRTTI